MELRKVLEGLGLTDGVAAVAQEALGNNGFESYDELAALPHSQLREALGLKGVAAVPTRAQLVLLDHMAIRIRIANLRLIIIIKHYKTDH